MSQSTGIEWTDATWNPIWGCSRVSEGCRHCYAEAVAARFSGPGMPYEGLARRRSNGEPQWTGKVRLIEEHLTDPLRWRKPRRVFVNSMSDLFHEGVSDETIARIFNVMSIAKRHTFQILTKRPERMRKWVTRCADGGGLGWITHDGTEPAKAYRGTGIIVGIPDRWPLPNVWLGVSAENQPTADERIPLLLQTPAAVRFISAEPLLGPVDLTPWLTTTIDLTVALTESLAGRPTDAATRPRLDWCIAGGESGPNARPCAVEWIRSIVEQCQEAGVAVFVKQLGTDPGHAGPDGISPSPIRYALKDRKGGDPSEWPEDLRVREFPCQTVAP